MNLETGSIVGDYQIVGTLGAGGMGKVFKVRNTISDRIEAMKVLLPDLAGEPDLADRFLREIKVLASLEHPNIAGLRTAVRRPAMLGCSRLASTLISRRKRSARSGSPARSGSRTFMASMRSEIVFRTLKTLPIPPAPSVPTI